MANIKSLNKSISDMLKNEVFAHIKYLRELRRILKEVTNKKKSKSKTTKKKTIQNIKQSINSDISKMSDTQREELYQQLLKIKERKDGKY